MIDAFKSMGALAGLMKNKDKLEEVAARIKVRLAETQVTGEAGAGAVRVRASAEMKVLDVHVEPAMAAGFGADETSREMAQRFVAEATNDALAKARDAAAEIVGAEAAELGLPPMPMDIGKLLT